MEPTSSDARRQVLAVAQNVLEAHGTVRQRRWGDVVSLELVQDDRISFSVQIASRDVMLETPQPLGWVSVMADGIHDIMRRK